MSTPSPLAGLRVLVVDDDFMVAIYIESLLEDIGCKVVGPIGTIGEAIAIVQTEQLDGALLDANLHGHSSEPIAVELIACSIPFVLVTGYGRLALQSDVLNNAPRLSKPFSTNEFNKILATTFLPLPGEIDT